MQADLLVAEIGSTTTLVTAFDGLDNGVPRTLGQGQAPTTVLDGDVTVGLRQAVDDLRRRAGVWLDWRGMVASSSAAGGLRMTVHGLVYDMTVKAAREAALGAGANIKMITAGELGPDDIREIQELKPNITLLAGGVDYGEKKTVLANARALASAGLTSPVIYAGNQAVRGQVERILKDSGVTVVCVDNVYPHIDQLNVEPTRAAIQSVFEKHITEAPGMAKIRQMVSGRIIPTPGAVMLGAQLLQTEIGDLMVVDVGGATTDVHSVTDGDPEVASRLIAPEPFAKRTVEGDLGVFINAANVLALCDRKRLTRELDAREDTLMRFCRPIPSTDAERHFSTRLTQTAAQTAVGRHAGQIEYLYGPAGRLTLTRGKDLTTVQWIIGTGGALTRLPNGRATLESLNHPENSPQLFPRYGTALLDRDYILAAAGLMADLYPRAALTLMKESLRSPRQPGKRGNASGGRGGGGKTL